MIFMSLWPWGVRRRGRLPGTLPPMKLRTRLNLIVAGLTATFIGVLWTLIECGFLDGTPGPNKYGPSPKGLGGEPTPTIAAA